MQRTVLSDKALPCACKSFDLQVEFKFGVRKKRKNTNKVRAYLFVVRSTQNKWCCRTSCFALDTACPICLLCPLRTISANAVRLHLSLLAVYRDLLISDCYRRSIACNGRCPSQQCKHCCLQIVRFAGGVQVRCPQKRKNTNKVRAYLFVVRSPRLELGRCNHTPLKRTRLPIPP